MAATGRASRWRRVSLLWHYLHALAKLAVISCSTVLYGCGLCAVSTLALVLVGEKRIKVNRFMMQR